MPLPHRAEAFSDAFVWRLSVCLSVMYTGPKSRTERPRKTKIGTEVAHVTRNPQLGHLLRGEKVKSQLVVLNSQHAGNRCHLANKYKDIVMPEQHRHLRLNHVFVSPVKMMKCRLDHCGTTQSKFAWKINTQSAVARRCGLLATTACVLCCVSHSYKHINLLVCNAFWARHDHYKHTVAVEMQTLSPLLLLSAFFPSVLWKVENCKNVA